MKRGGFMSKYAYIVAADSKYTPELCSLLGSLEYVGNKQDVHVIGINLDKNFTDQFPKLSYNVILHEVSEKEVEESRGISEVTCRKRYWYAATIGQSYDAVCVLDADLIFCRDPFQFFVIAEKTGYILGPCKEQNKVYDTESDDHFMVDGKWIWNIPQGFYNDKDMCNCPVFIDAKVWKEALEMEWDVFLNHGFKAADMDAMNLAFLQYGGYEKTIKLPGLQWLGTNEQMLKPYMRAVERRGQIFNECGPEIFCYHGHFAHKRWRDCQIDNRHNCASGYLKTTECCDAMAVGSMNLLYENFKKMLWLKIHIEKKNYRHSELGWEEDYSEDLWN